LDSKNVEIFTLSNHFNQQIENWIWKMSTSIKNRNDFLCFQYSKQKIHWIFCFDVQTLQFGYNFNKSIEKLD
jgi:hypothetical protein